MGSAASLLVSSSSSSGIEIVESEGLDSGDEVWTGFEEGPSVRTWRSSSSKG